MLRVRDERRHTIQALQVAYQSSLAYGVRHTFECERALNEMASQAAQLEQANGRLRGEVEDLRATLEDLVEERVVSRRERAEMRAAEIDALKTEAAGLLEELSNRLVRTPHPASRDTLCGAQRGGGSVRRVAVAAVSVLVIYSEAFSSRLTDVDATSNCVAAVLGPETRAMKLTRFIAADWREIERCAKGREEGG